MVLEQALRDADDEIESIERQLRHARELANSGMDVCDRIISQKPADEATGGTQSILPGDLYAPDANRLIATPVTFLLGLDARKDERREPCIITIEMMPAGQ